jgi:hypothetical protein
MLTSSPGAISRTKLAPTMSSAAVSLATTQPLSSRPSTSGRKPCGSRAAYSVCSSMKTSEYAPLASGSTAAAARSTWLASRSAAAPGLALIPLMSARSLTNNAVSTSVSEVAAIPVPPRPVPVSRPASSRVLIRFPLWPSARLVESVERKVGCALAQVEAPVVEYRQCPTAMCPRRVDKAGSSKTWATSPISLCTTMRWPSLTAIPADSCPRCCNAYSP